MDVDNRGENTESDQEIKSILLKILKKLSHKSDKKVEVTNDEINETNSEIQNTKPATKQEEENIQLCTIEEYLCDTCDITFKESNEYLSHFLQYHGQILDEITYDCAKCYKSFTQHQLFMEHVKIILEKDTYDEKPTNSYKENESFYKGTKLIIHEGHKDHKCESCGKSFTRAQHLKKHIHTVHEGRKDYKCDSCNKLFSHAHHLKKHINTNHLGHKN